MATLMKCTQPHWQGNKFIDVGTVLPAGHHEAIPQFFEAFEVDETPPPTLQDRARELGIKRVGSKSDERLATEIAAVEAGQAADDEPDGESDEDAGGDDEPEG